MLRKIFIGLFALLVGLSMACMASTDDIAYLQGLVDAGGTVVLDRDLSLDGGSVVVGNDVVIMGNGKTIIGGAPTFLIDNANADVTISGVNFVRPIGAAVQVYKCKTANISDNIITDVTLDGVKEPIGAGIRISELLGSPWDPIPLDPSEVADLGDVGKVVVENNIIDVLGDFNPPKVYYSGGILAIYIIDTGDDDNVTELSIVGNTVSNPGDSGINVTATAGVSKTEILGNTVTQRTYKNTTELMPTVFATGIGTYYYFNRSWDPVNDVGIGPAPVTIKDNEIYNCPAAGMVIDCLKDSLIENNYIEMVNLGTKYNFGINLCIGGIPNPGRADDIPRTTGNTFLNNTIVGEAKLGFRVSENSTKNVFLDNDTSGLIVFEADDLPPPNSGYHYSFVPSGFGGACHNRIKGESDNATILDPDSCNVF